MPYIKNVNNRREILASGDTALNAGELNYQIFKYVHHTIVMGLPVSYDVIKIYVENFLGDQRNYQKYNDITGVLVCCYKELQRRLGIEVEALMEVLADYDDEIADYEDEKCSVNGDVF